MKRLIFGIVAGLLISGVLSSLVDHVFHTTGVYPPYGEPNSNNLTMFMAFSYRAIFGVLSGYVTAVIARERAHKAVLILGTIGSVLWLLGAIALWDYAPAWYNVMGIFTGIPIALLGKSLHNREEKNIAQLS